MICVRMILTLEIKMGLHETAVAPPLRISVRFNVFVEFKKSQF